MNNEAGNALFYYNYNFPHIYSKYVSNFAIKILSTNYYFSLNCLNFRKPIKCLVIHSLTWIHINLVHAKIRRNFFLYQRNPPQTKITNVIEMDWTSYMEMDLQRIEITVVSRQRFKHKLRPKRIFSVPLFPCRALD